MKEEEFEAARVAFKTTVTDLLQEAKRAQADIAAQLKPLEEQERDFQQWFATMETASAKMPFGPFARAYTVDLKSPKGPLFTGLYDDISDEFGILTDDGVEAYRAKYLVPAVDACTAVFESATDVLRKIGSKALTLRYFSNSEPLLERFAHVLALPWAVPASSNDMVQKGTRSLPYFMAQYSFELPPHTQIKALRRAQVDTLRLLNGKLKEVIATLETAIAELPIASQRKDPAPVPHTWNDYSVTIAENATVSDSAVGAEAANRRGIV